MAQKHDAPAAAPEPVPYRHGIAATYMRERRAATPPAHTLPWYGITYGMEERAKAFVAKRAALEAVESFEAKHAPAPAPSTQPSEPSPAAPDPAKDRVRDRSAKARGLAPSFDRIAKAAKGEGGGKV